MSDGSGPPVAVESFDEMRQTSATVPVTPMQQRALTVPPSPPRLRDQLRSINGFPVQWQGSDLTIPVEAFGLDFKMPTIAPPPMPELSSAAMALQPSFRPPDQPTQPVQASQPLQLPNRPPEVRGTPVATNRGTLVTATVVTTTPPTNRSQVISLSSTEASKTSTSAPTVQTGTSTAPAFSKEDRPTPPALKPQLEQKGLSDMASHSPVDATDTTLRSSKLDTVADVSVPQDSPSKLNKSIGADLNSVGNAKSPPMDSSYDHTGKGRPAPPKTHEGHDKAVYRHQHQKAQGRAKYKNPDPTTAGPQDVPVKFTRADGGEVIIAYLYATSTQIFDSSADLASYYLGGGGTTTLPDFSLYVGTNTDGTTGLGIVNGNINGVLPDGMTAGATIGSAEAYIIDVSGSGFAYLIATTSGTGDQSVTSVSIATGDSQPADSLDTGSGGTYYLTLGDYSVDDDGNITIGGGATGIGSQYLVLCRDWFNPTVTYSALWQPN